MSTDMRERILTAAAKVFQEQGFRGATTRRIAEEADVNEVTLFRHFGSKERLLREALSAAAAASDGPVLPTEPSDPRGELTAWCDAHMRELYEVRALIRTSMGEFEAHPDVAGCGNAIPAQLEADLRAYLGRLQERGLARRDLDVGVASNLLLGALFSDALSRDLMPERYSYGMAEAPGRYVRLFLEGVE